MEKFILEELDRKEQEFIAKHNAAPKRLLLDPYSYVQLAAELDKDLVEEDLRYLHDCYEIIVHGLSQTELIEFLP
jgi:hypothetical protein